MNGSSNHMKMSSKFMITWHSINLSVDGGPPVKYKLGSELFHQSNLLHFHMKLVFNYKNIVNNNESTGMIELGKSCKKIKSTASNAKRNCFRTKHQPLNWLSFFLGSCFQYFTFFFFTTFLFLFFFRCLIYSNKNFL